MFLIIVADSEIESRLLEESFEGQSVDIEVCQAFEEMEAPSDDFWILVSLSQSNIEQAKTYAGQTPVFAISDDEISGDFEEVFIRPVCLGRVVRDIKQSIQQYLLRKALAPIQFGALILDPTTSYLSYTSQEKSVRLTEKEMAILVFLSRNQGSPVSRQQLLGEVWGYVDTVETHTLETHIYRLRQKIQTQLGVDNFLVTGDQGYSLKF